MAATKKLTKSKKDVVIGGVCGGLGEYFDIDPVIFRLIFVFAAILNGTGIALYFILWLVIPEKGKEDLKMEEVVKENAKELEKKAKEIAPHIENPKIGDKNALLFGGILILAGVIFLIQNFIPVHLLGFFKLEILWPIIIIALGVFVLVKRGK